MVNLRSRATFLNLLLERVKAREVMVELQQDLNHQLQHQSNPSLPQHQHQLLLSQLPPHPNHKKKQLPKKLVPLPTRLTPMIHQGNLCRLSSHTKSASEQPPCNSTSIWHISSHRQRRTSSLVSNKKRESKGNRNKTELN